jgi:hypothetical protein
MKVGVGGGEPTTSATGENMTAIALGATSVWG